MIYYIKKKRKKKKKALLVQCNLIHNKNNYKHKYKTNL